MKTLIMYLYREDPKTLLNLKFFIDHGIVNNEATEYIFIINDYHCSVDFPNYPNVTILRKPNSYDLPSYINALKAVNLKHYQHFIFINSSCIGPFIPMYEKRHWYEIFTQELSDKVKLVAPIIEIPKDNYGREALNGLKNIEQNDSDIPFLHTYMFATDTVGIQVLIDYKALTENVDNQNLLIHKYERLISSSLLNEGYGIKSLMLKYKHVDFSNKINWDSKKWSLSKKTCPEIPKNYDGIDVNPLEIIFVKNIRRKHSFRNWRASGISFSLQRIISNYKNWG